MDLGVQLSGASKRLIVLVRLIFLLNRKDNPIIPGQEKNLDGTWIITILTRALLYACALQLFLNGHNSPKKSNRQGFRFYEQAGGLPHPILVGIFIAPYTDRRDGTRLPLHSQ